MILGRIKCADNYCTDSFDYVAVNVNGQLTYICNWVVKKRFYQNVSSVSFKNAYQNAPDDLTLKEPCSVKRESANTCGACLLNKKND